MIQWPTGTTTGPVPPMPTNAEEATARRKANEEAVFKEKMTSVCPLNVTAGAVPGALLGFLVTKEGYRWKGVAIGAAAGTVGMRFASSCKFDSGFEVLGPIMLTGVLGFAAITKGIYLGVKGALDD